MSKLPNMVKLLDRFNDRIVARFYLKSAGIPLNTIWARRKEKRDFPDDQRQRLNDVIYEKLWLQLGNELGFLDRYKAEVAAATEKKILRRLAVEAVAAKTKPDEM